MYAEYNSGGTEPEQFRTYFRKRGYCSELDIPFKNNCDSYHFVQEQIDKKREFMIYMAKSGNGHIEHLVRVYIHKNGNKCLGVTNSWGSPAIIRGGNGDFFHSKFELFSGNTMVSLAMFSTCSEDFCKRTKWSWCGENGDVEQYLGFPETTERSVEIIKEYIHNGSHVEKKFLWAIIKRMAHILYREGTAEHIRLAMMLKEKILSSPLKNEGSITGALWDVDEYLKLK